jgi:uncharacterized protein YjbJ (UPF0337 family)
MRLARRCDARISVIGVPASQLQRWHMDKEHVKGAADNLVGKTKEAIGNATGNKKLETQGRVDQLKGTAHNAAGNVKDAAKEAIENVRNPPGKR